MKPTIRKRTAPQPIDPLAAMRTFLIEHCIPVVHAERMVELNTEWCPGRRTPINRQEAEEDAQWRAAAAFVRKTQPNRRTRRGKP